MRSFFIVSGRNPGRKLKAKSLALPGMPSKRSFNTCGTTRNSGGAMASILKAETGRLPAFWQITIRRFAPIEPGINGLQGSQTKAGHEGKGHATSYL